MTEHRAPVDERFLDLHLRTLFTLDESGDLLTTNEPYLPARRPAPALFLTCAGPLVRYAFRHDVPPETRARLAPRLAEPFRDGLPPAASELRAALSAGRAGGGPAFRFPRGIDRGAGPSILHVTPDRADCLAGTFPEAIPELPVAQPCCALLSEGRAVSICITVRRSDRAVQAGVETRPGFRGRGYAPAVTAEWARLCREEGVEPLYSCASGNRASLRVAARLALIQYATDYSVI